MSHPHWSELLAKLAPGIVLAVLFVLLFIVFLTRPRAEEKPLRRDGSWLMPRAFIAFWYWLIDPLISRFARWGVRPNHITLFALVLALLTGVALATGSLMLGAWLLVAGATCDLLDGLLARKTGAGSTAGAFLDSVADRCAEGLVFGGLAFYGAGGPLTWVAIWALLASLLVSYARARGEGLGVDVSVGLMQRPERTLMLILVLFATPIVAALSPPTPVESTPWIAVIGVGLLGLLSTFTVLKRVRCTLEALDRQPGQAGARSQGAKASQDEEKSSGGPAGGKISLESNAEAAR